MKTELLDKLLQKVLLHPDNTKVLRFLMIDLKDKNLTLRFWEDSGSPHDEGGILFFDEIAKKLPNNSKYSISGHNFLIEDRYGKIFGFHYGRATFIYRWHFFNKFYINSDNLRIEDTLDGLIDIRELGENWVIDCIWDEDDKLLLLKEYEIQREKQDANTSSSYANLKAN